MRAAVYVFLGVFTYFLVVALGFTVAQAVTSSAFLQTLIFGAIMSLAIAVVYGTWGTVEERRGGRR